MEELNLGLSSRSHNIFLMAIHLYHDPLLLYRTSDSEVSGREAVTLLDSYRGIGPKIAGCVALMSLEKLDAFPVDRWMQRALVQCDLAAMPERLAERVRSRRTMTEAQQYRVAEWARGVFRRVRRLRQPVPVSLDRAPQGASWPEQDLTPLRAGSDR